MRVDGKSGYINQNGTLVIPAVFEAAAEFSEGLAAVRINGKWGFIDESGKVIIEPKFSWVHWSGFSDGIVAAGIDPERVGGIDKTGAFVISPIYVMADKFSDGFFPVRLPTNPKDFFEKWVYLDADGRKAIDKEFFRADSFVNGRAFVKVGFDEWALIDKSGVEVTKKHFSSNDPIGQFSNGLAAVRFKDKWGFINNNGDFVIKPQYDDADNFSEGLAAVRMGCNYGFVDARGKFVIAPIYSWARKFSDGLASVAVGSRPDYYFKTKKGLIPHCSETLSPQGYINKSGKMVIAPDFEHAFPFSNGVAQVSFGEPSDVIGAIGMRGTSAKPANIYGHLRNNITRN